MTLQDWIARLEGLCAKATMPGTLTSYGDRVVHRYHDEQGRRCTQFVAVCSSTMTDNEANAAHFAAFDPTTARLVLDVVRAAQDYTGQRGKPDMRRVGSPSFRLCVSLDRLAAHVEGKETG